MKRKYKVELVDKNFYIEFLDIFNKTNEPNKIQISIKSVAFKDKINFAMLLLFRYSVLRKIAIKNNSNNINAKKTNMLEHFITNVYRTTGFIINQQRKYLIKFFISNRKDERIILIRINIKAKVC